MSYANSIFTSLINFIADKKEEPNLKLSYKIMLYSFFNPGAGIIISSFSLYPYCKGRKKTNIRGIILSILGIIIGIIVLFSPIYLIIGSFIKKITKRMVTLFPITITLIYIGIIGIIFSFITSGFNKRTVLESARKAINTFDIFYCSDGKIIELYSTIGLKSFLRFLANMIIPGFGTLSLLCKYRFNIGIILSALFQLMVGGILFFTTILIIFRFDCKSLPHYNIYYILFAFIYFFATGDEDDKITRYYNLGEVLSYFYLIGLCFYLSGLVLIFICEYIPNKNSEKEIPAIACIILNVMTGGIGTSIFSQMFFCSIPKQNNIVFTFSLILTIIILQMCGYCSYFGTFFCLLFFPKNSIKILKILFPIVYVFNSIIFGILILVIKKKNNTSQ